MNKSLEVLREIAETAVGAPEWYPVGVPCDVVSPDIEKWKPVYEFCKHFTAVQVLALFDELERLEGLRNSWFRTAKILGSSLDSAEKRLAELERIKNDNRSLHAVANAFEGAALAMRDEMRLASRRAKGDPVYFLLDFGTWIECEKATFDEQTKAGYEGMILYAGQEREGR